MTREGSAGVDEYSSLSAGAGRYDRTAAAAAMDVLCAVCTSAPPRPLVCDVISDVTVIRQCLLDVAMRRHDDHAAHRVMSPMED